MSTSLPNKLLKKDESNDAKIPSIQNVDCTKNICIDYFNKEIHRSQRIILFLKRFHPKSLYIKTLILYMVRKGKKIRKIF